MTSQKDCPTQHEMRLDGSLLDDGRLSYSLGQVSDDDNNHNSSLTPVTVHLMAPSAPDTATVTTAANTITALPAAWLTILMA
ncbi:hypothetical protein ACLK19_21065 [Escherichia coli]